MTRGTEVDVQVTAMLVKCGASSVAIERLDPARYPGYEWRVGFYGDPSTGRLYTADQIDRAKEDAIRYAGRIEAAAERVRQAEADLRLVHKEFDEQRSCPAEGGDR